MGYGKNRQALKPPSKICRCSIWICSSFIGPAFPGADWKPLVTESWRALERLYDEGAVRAIGVCNFLPQHLLHVLKTANTVPMIDQFEFHPGYPQYETLQFCQSRGIQAEAWSPLGRGRLLEDPLVLELAKKYGKSPAQICLRFCLQNNVLPLPKSSAPERMKANLDIFDFRDRAGGYLSSADHAPDRLVWASSGAF